MAKFKLETKDLLNVEIFAEGKWNGQDFTGEDLDEMIENFKAEVSDIFVTVDHDPSLTEATKKVLGAVSLGWVEHLWRDGKKLLANIKQVPKMIAELVEAGALKQKSIELWHDYEVDGKNFHNVIDGITFTGRIPAVNTLADALVLYKQEGRVGSRDGARGEKLSLTKENRMDTIEIKRAEFDALVADRAQVAVFKKDAESLKSEFERVRGDLETAKAELETAKTELTGLQKFKTESEKAAKVAAEADAQAYVEAQVKAGKLLPKFSEFTKKQLMTLTGEDREMFRAEIEARKPSIYTQDMGSGSAAGSEEISKEDDAKTLDAKVRAQMTRDGLSDTQENYIKTAKKLGIFAADKE